ncbi:hypothetical protein [Citrobacter sp. FR21RM1OL9030]|uniref:hypothetical protein n=1 Tax=Citrobacter sp. FR21RM1OL9030 TaxID=3381297 RepID=UPI003A97913E|nr:hypothetical protein [Citrobacter koseri]
MRLNDSIIKNLKPTDQSYYVFRNDIGKKHYDRYDYIVESRETTLKWEKALQFLLTNDGLDEINLIVEKKKGL